MKLIYIAGPFRGNSQWRQEQNIRAAEELALEVWKLGAVAICPHLNTRYFQGELPDDAWLTGDLEILARCDAMLVTENWRSSQGTIAEIGFAELHNIPIYYDGRGEMAALDGFIRGEG